MSAKTDEILEQLKTLSLLEASELVKQIEDTFGVSAAAPAGGAIPEGEEDSDDDDVPELVDNFDEATD